MEHDTTCQFTCSEGFKPSGDGKLKCTNGIFETDETCVEVPCDGLKAHISTLDSIERTDVSRFGTTIGDMGCTKFVDIDNVPPMNSRENCLVECAPNHEPSVRFNQDPNMRLLKLECLGGVINEDAKCVPNPCDISDFFVYNMKDLNCNFGATSVDAYGRVTGIS